MSDTLRSLRCQRCHTANAAESRYCEACGVELVDPMAATRPFDASASQDPVTSAPQVWASPVQAVESERMLEIVRAALTAEYDVEREIGRGGMAIVYKATERELRRTVALKVLPPELALGEQIVDRFKREAQMAAALDHPNIIPIYRVGQTGSLSYLAMKYVEGPSLADVIDAQGALLVTVVVTVLRAAASALAFAHEHGIVHRDIKPANILLDGDGRVIVTDFGVARAVENASMTSTGSVIGTPYFMSPEQCAGKVAGPQSDQYSLGVVAFQMLTGTVPFHADTLAAIMQHHFFTPAPDVRVARADLPPELVTILDRMLSKDPDQRYGTTRELLTALKSIRLAASEPMTGESMLRSLAQGRTVATVSTEALPPLADTMHIVAAHDALRRSSARAVRLRRQAAMVAALVAAAGLALWMSGRQAPVPRVPPAAPGAVSSRP
jgi:serine/threonine protein kinase